MKQVRLIMGMPITVDIVSAVKEEDFAAVFDYFTGIDERFSTYKPESEMMKINRGEISESEWSDEMRIIFMLAEDTKLHTGGFFDIRRPRPARTSGDGEPGGGQPSDDQPFFDPSGIVKGWAIWNAAKILEARGFENFYIDAGGDIQTRGTNAEGGAWSIGIKNPFRQTEIVKTVYAPADGFGIATSGTYIRGDHIYNPHDKNESGAKKTDAVSFTVIGPNVYEADRFATAVFAMSSGDGTDGAGGANADATAGIRFIENLPKHTGLEGYMIDGNGIATMTSGFEQYIKM